MTEFPPDTTDHELPHLGALLKRMRQVRGLSQSDIARALGVTSSAISKFEGTGRSRRNQIVERYIGLLQGQSIDSSRLPYPLSSKEAALLLQLGSSVRSSNRHELAVQLCAYDFALLASANCPATLKELLQVLRRTQLPALIMDGLWFIHAVNGAMLNAFGIHPESPFLRQWESWHLLATEFVDDSPVRTAHLCADNAVPPNIWAFFHATAQYLFTPQMRILLRQLHELSARNNMHFSEWWYSATAFALYFQHAQMARVLRHGKHHLCAALVTMEPYHVPITTRMSVPYYLGIWQTVGVEVQTVLGQPDGPARQCDVFLAADYDSNHTFHVNCWPEVAKDVPLG